MNEWSREGLVIHVARQIRTPDALEVFADLRQVHGAPVHICYYDGPEIVAWTLRG